MSWKPQPVYRGYLLQEEKQWEPVSSFNSTFVQYGLLLGKEAKKNLIVKNLRRYRKTDVGTTDQNFFELARKEWRSSSWQHRWKKNSGRCKSKNTKMKIKNTKLCHYRGVEEIERRRTCQGQIPHDLLVAFQKKIGSERQSVKICGVRLLSIISRILARVLARKLRVWSEEFGALNDSHESSRQNKLTVTRPEQWSCYRKKIKGHAKQRVSEEQLWKVLGG